MLPVFAIGVCVLHYGICLIRRSFQPLISITHKEDSTENSEASSSAPEIMKVEVIPTILFPFTGLIAYIISNLENLGVNEFIEPSFLAPGFWLRFRR